jgi:VWFA-related protein
MRHFLVLSTAVAMTFGMLQAGAAAQGQSRSESKLDQPSPPRTVRAITIPVTSRQRGKRVAEEYQGLDPVVRENGKEQKVLSIRGIGGNPLSLAILMQDDLTSSIGNEIKPLAGFIRSLPRGSRVFVGYMRSGSLEVRQKFTTDLDRAARALRVPIGSPNAAPLSPYIEMVEALKKFEALPAGRRAMLVVSDGLDTRSGVDSSSPTLSLDLERAIIEAQRRSVAVYSIYAPTVTLSATGSRFLANNGQGSLARLAQDTGGQLYSQGLGAPVSFNPFLTELSMAFSRQFAITYLSTHPEKGFHRIEITTERSDIELDYPRGYLR